MRTEESHSGIEARRRVFATKHWSVVHEEVGKGDDGHGVATRAEDESEHLDDVALILGSGGHQALIVEQRKQFGGKRSTTDDLAHDAWTLGGTAP